MQAQDKETTPETGAIGAPESPLENAAETSDKADTTQDSAQGSVDSAPSVEEVIRLAEQKAEEHHDAWLRAKAETENVRRRAQEDIAKASKFAVERFARELLAVKDALEMALLDQSGNFEALKMGVDLTQKSLVSAFEKFDLQEVAPAIGDKLDPNLHQAISTVPHELEANAIVQVMQKGYQLSGRLLRPAMVVVAKAPVDLAATTAGRS